MVDTNPERKKETKSSIRKEKSKSLPNSILANLPDRSELGQFPNHIESVEQRKNDTLSGDETSNLDQEDKFFIALGHEIRRKIIKYIGLHAPAGFTELKKETQSSTGTIYHHLDVIAELIYQDDKKKYHLTPVGERAFNFLNLNSEKSATPNLLKSNIKSQTQNKFADFLLCKALNRFAAKSELNGYVISGIILTSIAFLCYSFGIDTYLFFYLPTETIDFANNTMLILFKIYSFMSVFIGFFLVFILSELLCRLFFSKKENWKGLLGLLGIPYLPMLLYLILYAILTSISEVPLSILNQIIMLIFQIWSMILLAQTISTSKFLKYERGLMISVFIDYGTFIFLLIVRIHVF